MSVNAKEQFANLKWEQLLCDKYLVETCFSHKYDSFSSKQKLELLYAKSMLKEKKTSHTSFSNGWDGPCDN